MTDKERIEFLESIFGNNIILRNSNYGRGMRIHDTNLKGGSKTVREAIDKYYIQYKEQNNNAKG